MRSGPRPWTGHPWPGPSADSGGIWPRQTDVEHDAAGQVLHCYRQRLLDGRRDETLEAQLVRQIVEDAREGLIVLDNQDDTAVSRETLAIILYTPDFE